MRRALGESVRLTCEVTAITQAGIGWQVELKDRAGTARRSIGAVLYAGTAYQLAGIQLTRPMPV